MRTPRWLRSILTRPVDPQARVHPDGGPGPYSGPYPWEKDGEALPPAEARQVWGFDPATPAGAGPTIVGGRIEDGVLVIDHVHPDRLGDAVGGFPASGIAMAEALQAAFRQRPEPAECPAPIQQRPVQRVAVEPEDRRDFKVPGDPGYWDQFG